MEIVHGFDEPYSSQAGASFLQHFTFLQQETKVARISLHVVCIV